MGICLDPTPRKTIKVLLTGKTINLKPEIRKPRKSTSQIKGEKKAIYRQLGCKKSRYKRISETHIKQCIRGIKSAQYPPKQNHGHQISAFASYYSHEPLALSVSFCAVEILIGSESLASVVPSLLLRQYFFSASITLKFKFELLCHQLTFSASYKCYCLRSVFVVYGSSGLIGCIKMHAYLGIVLHASG